MVLWVRSLAGGILLAALLLPFGCTSSTTTPSGEDEDSSGGTSTGGTGAVSGASSGGSGAPPQGGANPGGMGGTTGVGGTAGVSQGGGAGLPPGGGAGAGATGGSAGSSGCPGGTMPCGTECKDLSVDVTNCGTCGNACRQDQLCTSGSCTCPQGLDCNGACVPNDAANCGTCGRACPANQVCSGGTCSSSGCVNGLTLCGTACIDVAGHPSHCGMCNNACPADQTCASSTCRCRVGQASCNGGACQDVYSDEANCGTCGNRCPTGATCTTGECLCPNGGIACSGACYDPNTDEQHCGNCTTVCSGSNQCLSGGCVDPNSVNCGGSAAGRTCTRDAFITLNKYWVNNNHWGVSGGVTGQQCIFSRCQSGDLVGWGTDWNWSGGSGVLTYVSLVFGWQWGWRIQNTGLPVQISSGQNVNCGWNYTVNTNGTINVAYDMWLHSINNPDYDSDPTEEVMVWLYRSGGAGPVGTLQTTVTIGGTSWDLYRGTTAQPVYSYVRTQNATTAVLNMMDFLRDLVTRGWVQNSRYLSSVQAGTEVFSGSGDLNVSGFYCRIQ